MKILISDFDGTLFDDNFKNNIEAINSFTQNGNIFIIATGRNITSLKNEIEEIELNYSYLICNDGGTIYDKDDNLLAYKAVKQNLVPQIYDILDRNRKAFTEVFIDMGGEYSIDTNDQCITLIAKIKDREKAENVLNNIITTIPEVNGYLSKNWINITSREVSKSAAIDFLVEKNNYDTNNIYTIGDDVNDVTMIKKYHGYVINHYEKLLNYSDNIVETLEELINILNESNNN